MNLTLRINDNENSRGILLPEGRPLTYTILQKGKLPNQIHKWLYYVLRKLSHHQPNFPLEIYVGLRGLISSGGSKI